MTVFSKNAIMAGRVELYCLACETQLRSDEDALQHIGKPIHKKNLDATSFLEKHRDDRVRKVKKGYFCEFCNLFMRTAAKVGPHVAEATHKENKVTRRLKREGNGLLAFDNVFIGESAWHGLIEDTCAVCDAEFSDAQIHKTDTWHALNLVLIKIEIGPDDNIYRKIDDSTFQCLTCNTVCAITTMAAHFEDTEHKKLYQQCCEAAKPKLNENNVSETVKDDNDRKLPEKETAKVTKEEAKKPESEKATEKEPAKDDKSKKSGNESPKKKNRKSSEKESAKEEAKSEVEKNEDKKPEGKQEEKAKESVTEKDKKPEGKQEEKVKESGTEKDKKPEGKQEEKAKESATEKTDKKSGKAAKNGLGKTDRDICKGLGAVNYITRDVCGKQWCVLCDWAMDDHAIEAHVKSRHHQTILKMNKERSAKNQTDDPETNGDEPNENKSRILDSATEFQKNDIKLDMVADGAYCRKCAKNIDFDFDAIKNHIDEHKKKTAKLEAPKEIKPFPTGSEKKTPTTLFTAPVHRDIKKEKERESRASSVASTREEDEVEAFAKQHNLTYGKGNNNAFCRLCVTKVPAAIKNIKEHVNGNGHKSKIAKTSVKTTANVPAMTPSHVFINSVITIENMFSKDIVINEKYAVNILSFLMITKNGGKLRCQACEVNVPASEVDSHKNTPKHERVMNEAMVASAQETEFIREIRPNLFHCGYCNQLEATWATMEAHLKSTAHREAKTAANWRMVEYVPMIAVHKRRQRMQLDMFTRMLLGQMFGDN